MGQGAARPRDAKHEAGWSPWVPWKILPRLVFGEWKFSPSSRSPLRRGGRWCFLCVFRISQAAAPVADKSKVENTEAKPVTAGFVGAALIIVINFIY